MKPLLLALVASAGIAAGLWGASSLYRSPCDHQIIRETDAERLRICAVRGSTDGQIGYGLLLSRQGQEVEAERWFQRAVASGQARAAMRIAMAFEAAHNPLAAERWYREAYSLGGRPPAFDLGIAYYRAGRREDAAVWFEREVALGGGAAAAQIAYTLSERHQDPETGSLWYRRAAQLGDRGGMVNLADRLAAGVGMPKNPEEALSWYRRAAAHPGADAYDLLKLVNAYDRGIGTTRDPRAALETLRDARRKPLDDSDTMTPVRMEEMHRRLIAEVSHQAS